MDDQPTSNLTNPTNLGSGVGHFANFASGGFFGSSALPTITPIPTTDAPLINHDDVSMGNLNKSYTNKNPAHVLLDSIKNLPKESQDKLIRTAMPLFYASVDPTKLTPLLDYGFEFETLTKKCNVWLSPDLVVGGRLVTNFNTIDWPLTLFYESSNARKHSIYTMITSALDTAALIAYTNNPAVNQMSKINDDITVLFTVLQMVDAIASKIVTFLRLAATVEQPLIELSQHPNVLTEYLSVRKFLEKQFKVLKKNIANPNHSLGGLGLKGNKIFISNILIPKISLLLEDWKALTHGAKYTSTSTLKALQTAWTTRCVFRDVTTSVIRNSVMYSQPYKPVAFMDNPTMALLCDNYRYMIEQVSNFHFMKKYPSEYVQSTRDVADVLAGHYLNNTTFACQNFVSLRKILSETNKRITLSLIQINGLDKTISTPSVGKTKVFRIVDGEPQPINPVLTMDQPTSMRLFQAFDSNLIITSSGREIRVYHPNHQTENLELNLLLPNPTILIPKIFTVKNIHCKHEWMVVTLTTNAHDREPNTSLLDPIGLERKIAYLCIFSVDKLKGTTHFYGCLPLYGLNQVGFLEDSSMVACSTREASRIDNTVYLIMDNLQIYEFNICEKTMFLAGTLESDDGSTIAMVCDGLTRVLFLGYAYIVLTNNGYILSGTLKSVPAQLTTSIHHIKLDIKDNLFPIDIAVQGHVLAVGFVDGTVQLIDRSTNKPITRLVPVKENGSKFPQKAERRMVQLVFNSNEEILFYCKDGSSTSWRINVD